MKGGRNARKRSQPGAGLEQAPASRGCRCRRQECWAGSTWDRCYRPHLLPVATRVGRTQPRPGKTAEETRTGERTAEADSGRSRPGQADPERSGRGKLLSPSRRRKCVEHVQRILPTVSERRACRVINQPRPTQRRVLKTLDDEESLTRPNDQRNDAESDDRDQARYEDRDYRWELDLYRH